MVREEIRVRDDVPVNLTRKETAPATEPALPPFINGRSCGRNIMYTAERESSQEVTVSKNHSELHISSSKVGLLNMSKQRACVNN